MFKPTANVLPKFSLFFAVITLAACGGSSDGGSGPVPGAGSGPGTVGTGVKPGVFDSTISTRPGRTLLSSSGNYAIYTGDQAGAFGKLTFRGDDTFSGDGTKVFFDETWKTVSGTLEGDVTSSEKFTAIFTPDATGSSAGWDITSTRLNAISDDPRVTMHELSEIYSLRNNSMEVTITANEPNGLDGTVTGSTAGGCVINGAINIPDPAYNIFEGNLEFDRCPSVDVATSDQRNGNYQIIGYLELRSEVEKRLVFAGTNGQVISLFSGDK